jgi:23S rRNA (cytosine1962-C5)-methyltransferase
MNKIFLKVKEEDRIQLGHPWVFDNEIGRYQGECNNGEVVEIYTKAGHYLGRGVINKNSKISVRIFTRKKDEPIDAAFFVSRVREALEARKLFYKNEESFRLMFAESDLVPGLIVDRFAAIDGRVWLSAQFLTLAVDHFKKEIVAALCEVIHPDGIFERSDVHVRGLEGIEEKKGWLYLAPGSTESDPVITIIENGIKLRVDLENGQKTGYFLDQKENRRLVAGLSKGLDVLDTFTHTGSFALNAWKGGAKSVIAADISQEAVDTVNANIALNGAGSVVQSVTADVFDLLKQYEQDNKKFDLVVLDPPAFTKSAKMIEKAYGGYKEINLRAMKILKSGGYLITCSCSHFFDAEHFNHMLQNAAMDAHKTVQILGKYGPGNDHPTLLGYPESDYLKCFVLRVW